jgi:hypothetical protein
MIVHERISVCCLSQMWKRGGVFDTVNFKTKLIYLLSLLINNKVILERILNSLIISISVPLFPWHNLWNIVVSPPEISSVINILRIFVSLFSLCFDFLHLCRQSLYHLCQLIHLRVSCRRTECGGFRPLFGYVSIIFISRFDQTTNIFNSTSITESCM